jgi:hypothetical protein
VLGGPVLRHEDVPADIGEREERHGVVTRLVEQDHLLAVDDRFAGKTHPHPPTQRLGEQHPLRQRFGGEEAAHRSGGQWALLPGQSHDRVPFLGCDQDA